MDRRELLKMIAVLTGGAVVGSEFLLEGCNNPSSKTSLAFTDEDIAFLNEVAETILPATQTPGAKAAHVGQFMTVIVNDCYEEKDQKIFHDGMNKLNDFSKKTYDKSFIESSPQQKHDLLVQLDKEQKEYMNNKKKEDPSHYFRMMKELTLLGYFTSEIGCTQARRYIETPGRFDGCVPYKKGDRAWA